jgi:hypothetical protein
MRRHAAWVAGLVFLAWPCAGWAEGSHDDSFSKEGLFKADVTGSKDIQLVAHPDVPITPETNVLWCGTLQLAWNEAIGLVGEKLHFIQTTQNVDVPTVADLLNREDFKRGDLDPGSYVAVADFERNQVEARIRAALEKTFHGEASPELIPPVPEHPGPNDFVAYAYLYKNLAFATPFGETDPLTFGDKEVKSFGFRYGGPHVPEEAVDQVEICDYRSEDDFVVRLKTKAEDDELILAKIAPGATLQATIQGVLERVNHSKHETPADEDRLAVPKLNFDLRRDFSELEGLVLQPSPQAKITTPLVIARAEQLVRFQLNEKGAILKSEAVVTMAAGAVEMPVAPRSMIFDKPFLILMKQAKAEQPYFALWVGNATLLVPAKD